MEEIEIALKCLEDNWGSGRKWVHHENSWAIACDGILDDKIISSTFHKPDTEEEFGPKIKSLLPELNIFHYQMKVIASDLIETQLIRHKWLEEEIPVYVTHYFCANINFGWYTFLLVSLFQIWAELYHVSQ